MTSMSGVYSYGSTDTYASNVRDLQSKTQNQNSTNLSSYFQGDVLTSNCVFSETITTNSTAQLANSTLKVNSGSVVISGNLTATGTSQLGNVYCSNMNFTGILTGPTGTFVSLKSTNFNTTSLNATSGIITSLTGTTIDAGNIYYTGSVVGPTGSFTSMKSTTINGTNGYITSMTGTNFYAGNVNFTGSVVGPTGSFTSVKSTNLNTTNLTSTNATINTMTGTTMYVDSLYSTFFTRSTGMTHYLNSSPQSIANASIVSCTFSSMPMTQGQNWINYDTGSFTNSSTKDQAYLVSFQVGYATSSAGTYRSAWVDLASTKYAYDLKAPSSTINTMLIGSAVLIVPASNSFSIKTQHNGGSISTLSGNYCQITCL